MTDLRGQIEKLIEAVVFISQQSEGDPNFGMNKLAKLLYYADCEAFVQTGETITGTAYVHFPHGPYPQDWHEVRRRMAESGDVAIVYERPGEDVSRYSIQAKRLPNLELLSPVDCRILRSQLDRFWTFNARRIEKHVQNEVSWLATEDGELMPIGLAYISSDPLSCKEISFGTEVAEELGLRGEV
ncbi:MAG: Panacea domain-containing protein [Chloroflexi bacterium]|nr:Panacea domain-containing protein [Chloroflexota bacterium]